jgi:hypothetical protein
VFQISSYAPQLQLTPRRLRLQHRLNGGLEICAKRARVAFLDEAEESKAEHRVDVIDLFAHDPKTGEVVLVMEEPRPWDGSDERLYQLQEKFNAYASFLLDGEMAAAHPELVGKRARIELRCEHMPDARAIELLALIHDRLAFQEIKMEVIVRNDESTNDE